MVCKRNGRLICRVLLSLGLVGAVLVYFWHESGLSLQRISSGDRAEPGRVPNPVEGVEVSRGGLESAGIEGPRGAKIELAREMGLRLRIEGEAPREVLLRERELFSDRFEVSLGGGGPTPRLTGPDSPRAWNGWAVSSGEQPLRVSLAAYRRGRALQVVEADGSVIEAFSADDGTTWENWREAGPGTEWACLCEGDGGSATVRGSAARWPLNGGGVEPLWLAQAGEDPATGQADKYVEPVRRGERYESSLRDVLLLLVLDQRETGGDGADNLEAVVSRRLASMANVAAVYEQQLGLRLLLQELILIPDEAGYEDVPAEDAVDDFVRWLSENRPQSSHEWDVALKWGAGLEPGTLGKAFVGTVRSATGIGILGTGTGWATCAHELGHVLGSQHSRGGIMNATASPGGSQDFYTDVSDGETAAKDIYDRSSTRLRDGTSMRHPEEIPFAVSDLATVEADGESEFDPMENDRRSVRNGLFNAALRLEELSRVLPPGAGTAELSERGVVFRPAEGYLGTAWFSYSVRGSVGNEGRGWLHKGDVAVEVGAAQADPRLLRLAPGQPFSFLTEAGGTVQRPPAMARADFSVDDPRLLVIRPERDAQGEDALTAGGAAYRIVYEDRPFVLRPDAYVFTPGLGRLEMHPLANDEGSGSGWLSDGAASIGTGTQGAEFASWFFPLAFALTGAALDDPSSGVLEVETRLAREGGETVAAPTGRLLFEPAPGVDGAVGITYWARDAAGRTGSGQIRVYLDGTPEPWIAIGHPVRYLVPENSAADGVWMRNDFSDASWPSGTSGVGFDLGGAYEPWIGLDLEQELHTRRSSVYLRFPFQVQLPHRFTGMIFRIRFDDGFVAYLNGREVARRNAAESLGWQSSATVAVDAGSGVAEVFDLRGALPYLREGLNVLAIHGLNQRSFSSDFLIQPELDGILGDRLAAVSAPAVRTVNLAEGTSLLLEGKWSMEGPLPRADSGLLRWTVAETESPQALALEPVWDGAALLRDPPLGNSRLRLVASMGGIETVSDVVIQVGEPFGFLEVGARVDAGADQEVDGDTAVLSGAVTPIGFEPFLGTSWRQIDGPAAAEILTPAKPETEVRFPVRGLYRFLLIGDTTSVRTVDETIVQVNLPDLPPELGGLMLEEAGETEARVRVEVLDKGGAQAELDVFWGGVDAGASPDGWDQHFERSIVVTLGWIPISLSNLDPGSDYFVRVRLRNSSAEVWSDALAFSTQEEPPDPYGDWAKGFFDDPDAEEASFQADPDQDGRNNFSEFALGSGPRLRDGSALELLVRDGEAVVVYQRSGKAREAGVQFELQAQAAGSRDWDAAGEERITLAGPEVEEVEVMLGPASGTVLVRLRMHWNGSNSD